eukprot:727195-Amphidinium_carterae.1
MWQRACPQFNEIAATLTTVHNNIHHLLETIHQHDAHISTQRTQILHLEAINSNLRSDFNKLLGDSAQQTSVISDLQQQLTTTRSTLADYDKFMGDINNSLQMQHMQLEDTAQTTTQHHH